MFRLMPKQQKLFEHFERQAQLAVDAAGVLRQMLDKFDDARAFLSKIEAIEQQGDDTNHEAQKMLQKGINTPFDPAEVLSLLADLDDVIDGADVAAHRMLLYKVQTIKPEAKELARLLEQACQAMSKAVTSLRTAKNAEGVLAHVVEVNRIENEGDQVLRKAVGALFENEKDAIELIRWKEIYEILEQAIDHTEHVADAIERVALRHAGG